MCLCVSMCVCVCVGGGMYVFTKVGRLVQVHRNDFVSGWDTGGSYALATYSKNNKTNKQTNIGG